MEYAKLDYRELGDFFRILRIKYRYPQTYVADHTGVSATYIRQLERGTKRPSLDFYLALCRLYDIPANTVHNFEKTLH